MTTRPVKVGLTDYLLGGDAGIKPGTRGVVLESSGWSSLQVRLDNGLGGPVTVRVSARDVRVVRRAGGQEAFARRSARLNAARAGVAVALLGPLIIFIARALLAGESKEGIIVAVLDGMVSGTLDLIAYAIANPAAAALWLAVAYLASRFAFRS